MSRHKLIWPAVGIALCAGCSYIISGISFQEDISQVIPKNDRADITAKVLRQQNFSDQIVVIIEKQGNTDGFELSETADEFLKRLQPLQHPYIKGIRGRVDEGEIAKTFSFVSENLPLFLDQSDYLSIEKKLSPDSIAAKMADHHEALLSPSSIVTADFIRKDPLSFNALALKKIQQKSIGQDFKLEDNYVVSKDGKTLLLFLEPKFGGGETRNNEKLADALEEIKIKINQQFKGRTAVSYFGSPLIAVANAKQIKSDIQKTVGISMLVLFVLLIFYFRNFFTPLIIFIPTAVSVLLALAFMSLIRDRLSAISLSIGAILMGITIDYALHILTHYKHKANIGEVYKEM